MTTQNQSFMTSTREERPRHRPVHAAFFILGMGLFFLAIGLNRLTIANMRTSDLIHLLATGGCLGVGLTWLVVGLVWRRRG